jgi:hypothetical protein
MLIMDKTRIAFENQLFLCGSPWILCGTLCNNKNKNLHKVKLSITEVHGENLQEI